MKVNKRVAGFLEAVGDRAMAQPPLADEGLAALLDLLGRGRISHVGVVAAALALCAAPARAAEPDWPDHLRIGTVAGAKS